MKILLLFDLAEAMSPTEISDALRPPIADEWLSEYDIKRTLESLGHEVVLLGATGSTESIIREINTIKPNCIFNLCEAFSGNRKFESEIAALLELTQIPYTGARSLSLALCKDKALSKMIASQNEIAVPEFKEIASLADFQMLDKFEFYPYIVKPIDQESSEGISANSVVGDFESLCKRVRYVWEKYGRRAIVEEFIEGTDLYVSVLETEKGQLEIFPARELTFANSTNRINSPRVFMSESAKWDDEFRAKWGVKTKAAANVDFDNLSRIVTKLCRCLKISGAARFDFRITPDGALYFIEANPNPSLSRKDDFAKSALSAGYSYGKLLTNLIENSRFQHAKSWLTRGKKLSNSTQL